MASTTDLRAHATHLVVFQHGLWGNEKDFRNFHVLFQQYFPQDEIYTHIAISNATSLSSLFQTYDGIDVGGTRLADEIEGVAAEMPCLSKFSIMGHSLGGLYARYCIGVLYSRGFFENVEPMNFVTLATPHMGIRRSQPTPVNGVFNAVMPNFFDLTGQQFTLKDTASDAAIALTQSVRKYPHRRPNVVYDDIDGLLLVQVPHIAKHPATTTLAEAKTYEVVECILREGILRMYRKVVVPQETHEKKDVLIGSGTNPTEETSDGSKFMESETEEVSSLPDTDHDIDSDEGDKTREEESSQTLQVVCIAEIDLLEAHVTVVLPEQTGRPRRRRHSLLRRASDLAINKDGLFWDIEIQVDASKFDEKITLSKVMYTIRIPYDELTTKWKWIVGISNASHGVHCRSQTAPASAKDLLVNSSAPTVLSCLTRGQFIQGLQLFRTRTLYASIFNDMQVPYSCGAIRAFNPYRTEWDPAEAARSPYYHHIVARSIWNAPLLRDTLPEDVKARAERQSSGERFSLVKMLSERTTSRRRYSSSAQQHSLSSFFSSSQSQRSRARSDVPPATSHTSSPSSVSNASPSSTVNPLIQERIKVMVPATSNSARVNTRERNDTDSDSSMSSDHSSSQGKRMPPFEDGTLLLDHADRAFSNDELRDSLRGMLISLQSVGWRRIDVHFHSPIAHMKIIAMTANPTKPLTKGLDVIHHVMDTFQL